VSSAIEALADFVAEPDRQKLAAGLDEDKLHDLAQILLGCDDPAVRSAIVREVIAVLPEFPEQAVMVALAEVFHKLEEAARIDVEECGS
jgi:hypothetical protein